MTGRSVESQRPNGTTSRSEQQQQQQQESQAKPNEFRPLWFFVAILVFDFVFSILLLTPFVPGLDRARPLPTHYTLYGTMTDLWIVSLVRSSLAILALLRSVCRGTEYPTYSFALHHANGDAKSRQELEQDALEQPWGPWLWQGLVRGSLPVELACVVTQVWAVVKALDRMNVELGVYASQQPMHPLVWILLLTTTLLALVEANRMDGACRLAAKYGASSSSDTASNSLLRSIGSSLSIPLLAAGQEEEEPATMTDEAGAANDNEDDAEAAPQDERGTSDIGPDAKSRATWQDLGSLCLPDLHLLVLASIFLLCAAIAQVYIPRYLGNILDALEQAFADSNNDNHDESMWQVPGFLKNVKLLVAASLAAGVFSGLRGSIFTVVGGRANIRLRIQLMDALFRQDIGFFDVTKTGDISSRLSSDTTLVGDQVTLNVNVFLRSLVQAMGVLLFMFLVSWQLSILAFISVPLITILSKWYGNYVRALTKLMQKKLADGNAVSEAALSSMATVRAFDAALGELQEFEVHMQNYLDLNLKSSIAYFGYAAFTTAVPQLVFAVVVFYGGFMVRNGEMTSGQLVSFLLYLQSLSDAFQALGWVFSALTQAVGAADKVFELMKREPHYKPPTVSSEQTSASSSAAVDRPGVMGIKATKTRHQRSTGLKPETIAGNITLDQVELYYPARPKRRVLNGLSLEIKAGQIVALVGKSGGGKSSLMSLIQHLYEPSAGRVMLDGHEVYQLAPELLSQAVCVVSQEPTLFARSVKRNIMYGLEGTDREPSMEEIEEAARLANAGFVYEFPQKFDTEVGERGVQLSGGQKQRIAIARALVRKPKVLLLDEATSALDAESEFLVQSSIDSLIARGKADAQGAMTVVIAAHRLSTVRNADNIFVIDQGKVVEQGSHETLMREKPDGAYAALIRRQLEAQEKLEAGNNTTSAK